MVAVSACMCGTCGSGVSSSTGDVLEMIVVRGVGGVYDMCMCLARGSVGGDGGEWMRELGLGFTNLVGTWGVLHMCLCFGCGGVVSGRCLFKVVGPGLVSISPAFVSSSASHPAGPHGRHAKNLVNRAPIAGGGKVRHNLHSILSLL